MTAVEPAGLLFERTAEVDALEAALAAAVNGSGRVVLLEGVTGTGKSELLSGACRRAGALGLEVLAARGAPLEQGVPFGLAVELFAGRLTGTRADVDELFRGGAALAAPLFSTGSDGPPETTATGDPAPPPLAQGLFWLAVNLAERSPLLVAVDDVQWSDGPSRRFLLYLAERVEHLPVALILAVDLGEASCGDQAMAHLRAVPHARVLRTGPLSPAAVSAWIRRVYFPEADDAFCRAVVDASGGNPFVAKEILRLTDMEGLPPIATSADRVRGMVPDTVVRRVRARLARLRPEAVRLAEAASVLGSDAHLRHAARLAELDLVAAAAAADDLIDALVVGALDPLEFSQQALRAAVETSIPPGRRGVLHQRAAAVLCDEDAGPERLAPHLLATSPAGNAEVAQTLQTAARRAVAEGDPARGLLYLRRALAEPLQGSEVVGLLVELGRVGAMVGDPEAVAHLTRAAELAAPDPPAQAEALYEAGRTLVGGGRPDEAAEYLERAMEEAGASPTSELRLRLLASQLQAARLRGRRDRRLIAAAETAVRRPGPVGPNRKASPAEPALVGQLAMDWLLAGRPFDEVRAAATRAVAAMESANDVGAGLLFYDAVAALAWADDLDAAEAALNRAEARAERRGLPIDVASARFRRAMVGYLRGSVVAAAEDGQRALDDAATSGWVAYLPAVRGVLALAVVELAQLERAAEVLDGEEEPEDRPPALPEAIWRQARATLCLVKGDPAAALEEALAAGRILTDKLHSIALMVPWRSLAAVAHHQLGSAAEARRLGAEEVRLARAFGAPRALGMALRAEGSIVGGTDGIVLLREAVDVLADSPARLEYGRALAELGAALRRRGQKEAADVLRDGLEVAEGCGATLLEGRLRDEIRISGVRLPRRRGNPAALTPAEGRVARLAADGLSNREIANRLYVSVGAVEFHLRNVYRKLGVPSRRELPQALPPED